MMKISDHKKKIGYMYHRMNKPMDAETCNIK